MKKIFVKIIIVSIFALSIFAINNFVNAEEDTTPPVVSNARIVTQNYSAPCDVVIEYDVTDDISGVKDDMIFYSMSSDPSIGGGQALGTKIVSGITHQITIHLESKYKKYTFVNIWVSDNAGNEKWYTAEELGLTNELDITPLNYQEDTDGPTFKSIEYNKNELFVPDSFEAIINVEDNESGVAPMGYACFKSADNKRENKYMISNYEGYGTIDNPEDLNQYSNVDGPYLFISPINSAFDSNGGILENKVATRLNFKKGTEYSNDTSEVTGYEGSFYLDKIVLCDNVGNKTITSINKENITVSKKYTLETNTQKESYINEIVSLPEGSNVLCLMPKDNQIIKKELFDAIKGKDITITFVTSYQDVITSYDYYGGIQWIINGKDIINETKDVDMSVKRSGEWYSKYVLPGYEFNRDLELDYWNNADWDKYTEEELMEGIHKLQKNEIEKYFSWMKEQGYDNTDEYLEKTLKELEHADAIVEDIIKRANGYICCTSLEFANNGLLPCKAIIRITANDAVQGYWEGTPSLNLYYVNGENYDLVEKNINPDREGYYNLTITHNSEYWLTKDNIEKLSKKSESNSEKNNTSSEELKENAEVNENIMQPEKNELSENTEKNDVEYKSKNPKTGDNIFIWINTMIVAVLGFAIIIKLARKK